MIDLMATQKEAEVLALETQRQEQIRQQMEKAQRKAERIAACGGYAHRLDPAKGTYVTYRMTCNYWRECESCFRDRKREFKERYEKAKATHRVGILEGLEEELRALVRGLPTDGYWRCPEEGDKIMLFFDARAHPEIQGNVHPDNLDWNVIAATPEGKRVSGKLGQKEQEQDPDEDYIEVYVKQVVFDDYEQSEAHEAWVDALNETRGLLPEFDESSLHWACHDRMEAFIGRMLEKGREVVYSSSAKIKVYRSELDWSRNPPVHKSVESEIKSISDEEDRGLEVPFAVPKPVQMSYQEAVSDLYSL